jgi:Methyltransferase small domain
MSNRKAVQSPRQQSKFPQSSAKSTVPLDVLQKHESYSPLRSEEEVFYCPEESYFYAYCFERFVLANCKSSDRVVEFGCGDGSPIIHALTRNSFQGTVHGYDLNSLACQVAESRIEKFCLSNRYIICNESFFEASRPEAQYLIANPPYLPSPDDGILMPALRGGSDGSGITRQLMTLDYPALLLMISSYSNPVDTIDHAIAQGYYVADFMVSPLQFGYYSSELKVKDAIRQLRYDQQAFYSSNVYFLAGVLFKKRQGGVVDLSDEFIKVMTTL